MDVQLDLNAAILADMDAAEAQALRAGGGIILAAAVARTPVDSGELVATAGLTLSGHSAAVSYSDWKAILVHENMYDHHDHGSAKFLELAVIEHGDQAYEAMASALVERLG